MRRNGFKVVIALCLALLLFACELNPGGDGTGGGQSGSNGSGGTETGGPGSGGGDKKEYPVKIKLVEAGETFFTIEWNALPGENVYDLSMVDDRTSFTGKSGYRGKETRATVKLLVPGETYNISVFKMDPDGKTAYRKSDNFAVTTASPSLATPEVTITESAYNFELNWPAVAGADRYHIYRLDYDSWRYYSDSTTINSFIHHLDHKKGGDQYSYKVIALTADGKRASGFSKVVTGTLKESTLNNWPLKPAVSSYEIAFSWDALPAGYKLDLSVLEDPSGSSLVIYPQSEGSTGYSEQDVESGKQYYYRFRLKQTTTDDASLQSKIYKLTVPQPELAEVPGNLKVSSYKSAYLTGYYDVEISWDAVPGAEEYYIFEDTDYGLTRLKGKSKGTSYKINLLNLGSSKKFKVKAVKHSTKEGSDYSAPLTVDIPK